VKEETIETTETVEEVSSGVGEDESRTKVEYIRGEDDNITSYKFVIYIKNKEPLKGVLSREELALIYRLYSVYGARLTQREVSRFFPEYSLVDFRRILRAFNITKASSPFPPHLIEEKTHEELIEMAFREKENNFLRTFEAEQFKRTQDLVKDQFREITKLRNEDFKMERLVEKFFNENPEEPHWKRIPPKNSNNHTLIIHLADLHVGAKVGLNSMYENEYNVDVLRSRLTNLGQKITEFIHDDTILIINLLGDMLDGMDNQTARRDHFLPQNMNNYEQVNNYLQLMDEFIVGLLTNSGISHDRMYIYSVPTGNHGGITEYTATKALLYKFQYSYGISCTLFEHVWDFYTVADRTFVLCHGKVLPVI